MHRTTPVFILLIVCAVPVPAQTTGSGPRILVDFGGSATQTGNAGPQWNDIHVLNQIVGLPLRDTGGLPAGAELRFAPALGFSGASLSGATVATPGSVAAMQGYPASAISDTLFGRDGRIVRFTVAGLDPSRTYDLKFFASTGSGGGSRATEYEITGQGATVLALDPAGNSGQVAAATGVVPQGAGLVTITVRAAAANTTAEGFFDLGALEINGAPGTPVAALGFSQTHQWIALDQGGPGFAPPLDLVTSNGAPASATLSAVDQATGQVPTWLAHPASSAAPAPVSLTVSPAGLPVGPRSAVVTASAPGYADATLVIELTVVPDTGSLELLYYGNSYTAFNDDVPGLVTAIAVAGGQPYPTTVARTQGGVGLGHHLSDPAHASTITGTLPVGQQWDFVVMQEASGNTTPTVGNPSLSALHASQIHGNVAAHSPQVRSILFQSWALSGLHPAYAFYYGSPQAMHDEITAGHQLMLSTIETDHGSGSGRIAPVGQPFAHESWPPSLYQPDLSHPSADGTLVAAQVVFSTVYGQSACAVSPDFGAGGSVATWMLAHGLTEQDWWRCAALADRAGSLTWPYPGSGEDLTLETGVNGLFSACHVRTVLPGESWGLVVSSPLATYLGQPSLVLVQAFSTAGSPGGLPGYAEVHLDPYAATVLYQGPVPGAGFAFSTTVPAGLSGLSVITQGFALSPSPLTGNPFFTATDAHESRVW